MPRPPSVPPPVIAIADPGNAVLCARKKCPRLLQPHQTSSASMSRLIDALVRQSVSLSPEGGCVAVRLPRAGFQRRSARQLSTRSSLCYHQSPAPQSHGLAATLAGPLSDDTFIPFVHGPLTGQTLARWPLPLRVSHNNARDIEPELEMNDAATNDAAAVEESVAASTQRISMTEDTAITALDHAILPRLHPVDANINTLSSSIGELNLDMVLPERTRADRRKDRKLRRERAKAEEKKAAAHADHRLETPMHSIDVEGGQVQSILDEVREANTIRAERLQARRDRRVDILDNRVATQMRATPIVRESWQLQKAAIKDKLGEQHWNPRKRISPDAIAGVRSLHASDRGVYSTERLADYFQISPDAVRRILKSKWQPREEEAVQRRERWERRGERKWAELASQGVRPPRKWRERGVGKAPEGEKPAWRKGGVSVGAGGGERWIEHRSPEELFARAAHTHAAHAPQRPRGPAARMSDRFL